ncbi:DUF11 domain-containing protein, partial [candidate division KSB1 bacterium]|nr:DUF11 domain-containing protein [candidate division KSB1 bacterium]
MLVMDASTSIGDTLEIAKQAIAEFYRGMQPVDRTGIIVFPRFNRPKEVAQRILPFTSDTTAIRVFVQQATTARGTPLNEALLKAIEMTSAEDSLRRRTIIVYTDGINDNNDNTAIEVIQQANRYNIPIFTIAVGRETDVDTLQQIAAQTGGLFFDTGAGQSFAGIYRRMSDLLHNKYDVNITKTASADTVSTGDTLLYTLRIENFGPAEAFDVTVTDSLPEGLTPLNWPGIQVGNVLTHTLPSLGVDAVEEITFAVIVTLSATDTVQLVNAAAVQAPCDIDSSNNAVTNTVLVAPSSDISVTKFARTDSFAVAASDTVWFARAGEKFSYTIKVVNLDSVDALDVVVQDFLPDSVHSTVGIDSLVLWNLGTLPGLADTLLTFEATVAPLMPIGTTELLNRVQVSASNEDPGKLDNNAAIFRVLSVVVPPPVDSLTDISVTKRVQSDSLVASGGDTTWFVRTGEKFVYSIHVVNEDTVDAFDVVVRDILPDSVTIADLPELEWQLGTLLAQADTVLTLEATLAARMPIGTNELLNQVAVSASNEDTTQLANN